MSGTALAGGRSNPPCTLATLPIPPAPDDATEVYNDAWKLNDQGVIVGTAYWNRWEGDELVAEESSALRWVGGAVEVLDGDVVHVLADGTEATGDLLYSDARGINRHGTIAGFVWGVGDEFDIFAAAVWDDGERVWRTIPLPEGADFSIARDINDAGHVLVNAFGAGSYIWRDGHLELLPLLPGTDSCNAFALNNLDMVTGWCGDPDGRMRAVVWWGQKVWELKTKGGETNWGRSIDDLGRVVGSATDIKTGDTYPAAWSAWLPGIQKRLGDRGLGNGVNNWGFAVGMIGINGGTGADVPRGMLWTPTGTPIRIGTLGGMVFPRDINNRGTIVGTLEVTEFEPEPFACAP